MGKVARRLAVSLIIASIMIVSFASAALTLPPKTVTL